MAERQLWEYLTIFVEADAKREEDFLRERWDWKDGIPSFTPQAMIPQLDALGDQGWELVHMQPVRVGERADVLMTDTSSGRQWTSRYFCVFKRPKF
ncbi:MAG TPA: hypothetical protein VHO69_11945 [Phototrophicaceae bacterium]|nr:hypothetical protein [Phototrophicaceae bacterium]